MYSFFCSIIIASLNEEDYIEKCLESLENQELDRAFYEIIVLDGMSCDSTREKVQNLQNTYSNLILMDNTERTAAAAFNIGIAKSKGAFIFILGAHATYPSNFLSKSLESIRKYDVECVGGKEESIGKTAIGKAFAAARNTPFGGGLSPYRYSDRMGLVGTVAFGCYRKDALIRAGGFDEQLERNQDNDLNRRLVKAGGKILFNPDIHFCYFVRNTAWSIFNQMKNYGMWEARLIMKRREHASPTSFVPLFFVICMIVSVILLAAEGSGLLLLSGLFIYTAAFLAVSLRYRFIYKSNPLLVFLMCLLIHLSIGLGFAIGLTGRKK